MQRSDWLSIPEIKERMGITHDDAVTLIREGIRNGTARMRLEEQDGYGKIPLVQFDLDDND